MALDPVMVRFPSQPASVPAARRFLTEVLVAGGAGALLNDARLLISELAANAVQHAGTDFSVTVHLSVQRLYVEVRDGDPTHEGTVRAPDPEPIDGNGLRIVAQLSDDWGVKVVDHGKIVWFSLAG
jgi:anti-sigma regulatory factor (Ser/Thr protein kinase)